MTLRALALGLALIATPALADAPRRVDIKVTSRGYEPTTLTAKPGEKLLLVFTASDKMGCCDSIVVPAANAKGTVTKDKPLEVAVTMPASGKLAFACSMAMCKGEVSPK